MACDHDRVRRGRVRLVKPDVQRDVFLLRWNSDCFSCKTEHQGSIRVQYVDVDALAAGDQGK